MKRKKCRWVPVSERLPKSGKAVLLYDGKGVRIGYLRPENKWLLNHDFETRILWESSWFVNAVQGFDEYHVTHWARIPKSPEANP